ncbi:MAG TPA: tetraacyldisaccharide 4'-kinase [Kiritimatiellia bacterium]|nr:tetraacyldisaccharide 4'-kinase [Kiritimatiellia bacterium]
MSTRLERFEEYILSIIEDRQKGKRHLPVRIFLTFLSGIFLGLVQFRLWLYKVGLLRHHAIGCQVISIGNLTVGGTGKTPIVEIFARTLQKSGRKVAILSRGYKKEEETFYQKFLRLITFKPLITPPRVVSDGEHLLLDSSMSGDEPFMLAGNLKDVVVIVDKNRVRAGAWAINKFGCDTLILDDGFQYMSLKHRLDIVLVDRTNPFGNRRLLPRGILREPVRNIKRAGFIFITKSNGDGAEELKKDLRKYNSEAEIVECRHCPRYLKNVYSEETQPLEFLKGMKIAAISGIARPEGFEYELKRLGADVVYHSRYADHHRYTQQEIINCINESMNHQATIIVTTEKDAVRFPLIERRDIPIYFMRVEIEMLSGEEKFHEWINRICFR